VTADRRGQQELIVTAGQLSCDRWDAGDDLVEVSEYLPVHLSQPLLAAGFGGGDDLDDLLALLVVLRQELWGW
jgi:hypothetical protein